METAGCIDEHRIAQQGIGPLQGFFGDFHRRDLVSHREYGHVQLFADDFQLGDGCRTVYVPGHHQRFLPVFPQEVGQFAYRGSLASALEPHQHDHSRRIGRHVQLALGPSQELDQLLMDDFYDILAGSEIGVYLLPHGPLLDLGGEFLDDLEVYIRF